MKTSTGLVVAMLCSGILLLAPTVQAHHSFAAEFDGKNCRDFTGILTKLDWQNPHAYFYVDVKEPDGHVEPWSFQTNALITLRRAGNDRQVFLDNVGKEVFVRDDVLVHVLDRAGVPTRGVHGALVGRGDLVDGATELWVRLGGAAAVAAIESAGMLRCRRTINVVRGGRRGGSRSGRMCVCQRGCE